MGILPLALINYITYSGGGFTKEQSTKPKIYSLEELQKMVIYRWEKSKIYVKY